MSSARVSAPTLAAGQYVVLHNVHLDRVPATVETTDAATVTVVLAVADDRATLELCARCSTVSAGHCERARIVLAIADGAGTSAVARMVGVSRPTVIKWRDRFAARGLAGLDDQPRSGRPKTIDVAAISRDAGATAGRTRGHAMVFAAAGLRRSSAARSSTRRA